MAAGDARIDWREAELEDLLNGMDGPVGRLLAEKAEEATNVARVTAPLQKPWNWSWGRNSTSYMPRSVGYLKASVHSHMGYTQAGKIFSGVNAAYGPTLFLQKPADQLHRAYPFLTEALYSVEV